MRPIKRRNLVHTCTHYRPTDNSIEQTLSRVKIDRSSSLAEDKFGLVLTAASNMVLIIDRINSIYDHMDIREQDRIIFKGEEYSVASVIEQTANITDEVHHWEVLLV